MKPHYNHLIWLGAGTAEVPSHVMAQAKQCILVDAREAACQALQQRFAGDTTIRIVQQCISSTGASIQWHQYNLPEFSATAKATGLTALFPGLKLQQSSEQDSIALIPFLTDLALGEGKKALLLDCPAQNADFLNTLLAQKHIQFDSLYITTSEQALYQGMQTQQELVAVLQQHGYQLEATDATDPDLPVVHFSRNPLWQQLQAADQQITALTNQLETLQATTKQQAAEQSKQAAQVQAELSKQLEASEQAKAELSKQLEDVQQQATAQNKQAEQAQAELTKQLEALQTEATKQQAELNKQLEASEHTKAEVIKQLADLNNQLEVSEHAKADLHKQLKTTEKQLEAEKLQAEQQQGELSQQLVASKQQLQIQMQEKQQQDEQLKNMTIQLEALKNDLEQARKDLAKQEQEKESLALKSVNLINKNEGLLKENKLLRKEVDKIEIQMDLLKELVKLPE